MVLKRLLCVLVCMLSVLFVACEDHADNKVEDKVFSTETTYEDRLQDDAYNTGISEGYERGIDAVKDDPLEYFDNEDLLMELHPNAEKAFQPISYMIDEMIIRNDFERVDSLRKLMVDRYEEYLDGFVVIDRQRNIAHELFCEEIQEISSQNLIFEGTDEFQTIQTTDSLNSVWFCDKCKDTVWFYSG